MVQQVINVGTAPNDGTGDTLKASFTKTNANFTELYTRPLGNAYVASATPPVSPNAGDLWYDTSVGVLSIRVDDGNTVQWVKVAPPGASSITNTTTIMGAPNCGRLVLVDGAHLAFKPYNGDRIKINGAEYAIPSGGVTAGLSNASMLANTTYYVYLYINAGALTGYFTTTGHMPSTTGGNVGVEIPSDGNNSFTLIGMVRTGNGSEFIDSPVTRYVLSWFNRRNLTLLGASIPTNANYATWTEINGALRVFFLTWGDEGVLYGVGGNVMNDLSGAIVYAGAGVDALPQSHMGMRVWAPNVGYGTCASVYGTSTFAEGTAHILSVWGAMNAGTTTYELTVSGMIRG